MNRRCWVPIWFGCAQRYTMHWKALLREFSRSSSCQLSERRHRIIRVSLNIWIYCLKRLAVIFHICTCIG